MPDGLSLLHAAALTAVARSTPRSHPKDEGLMSNGYHGARSHGRTAQARRNESSRGARARDTISGDMIRDAVCAIGVLAVATSLGCLPKVDFTPCAQGGSCPRADVPDASADRLPGCPDGSFCDAEVTDAPSVDAVSCAPTCRSGYTCVAGACVSSCNPQCAESESCVVQSGSATCVPNIAPDAGDVAETGDGTSDAAEGARNDVPDVPDANDVAVADAPDDRGGFDVTDAVAVLDAPDVSDVPSDICAAPRTICEASCVDTRTDDSHCGSCSRRCVGGERCAAGTCECPAGSLNCGLGCTDVSSDPYNCGACGLECTLGGLRCVSGDCVCPSGGTYCTRSPIGCADLQSSSVHCGACGNACPSTLICRAGRCVTP